MADRALVSAEEEKRISRYMMVWVNSYPRIPELVSKINFEQLQADEPGMALSTIQAASILKRYITGGHLGEYQFKLIYRIKPGTSNDARLKAAEWLDGFGEWAADNLPNLGDIAVKRVEATARASLFGAYENGDEDYQILMRMTYEVI